MRSCEGRFWRMENRVSRFDGQSISQAHERRSVVPGATAEGWIDRIRMSEQPRSDEIGTDAPTSAGATAAVKVVSRHVLEFEKPIHRLEVQIAELEALQTTRQIDYSKELRQLNNNKISVGYRALEATDPGPHG